MAHNVIPCVVCASSTVMTCGRCHSVPYCSTDCQLADWPTHHINCTQMPIGPSAAATPPLVETQRFKALVFFAHSPNVHWRMLDVHIMVPLHNGGPRPIPQFTAEINLGDQPRSTLCLRDVGGSPLAQPYQIFHRDSFLRDGSPINLGVRNLHPEITYPWAGNVVVFKFDGHRRQRYRHMEPSDLVQIAQFFRTYPEA